MKNLGRKPLEFYLIQAWFQKYIAYVNHIPTNELYCITFLFIHSLVKLTLHLAHSNTPIILLNMHKWFIYSFSV